MEILSMQTCGLIKRLIHSKIEKLVIGISGGLDSTLAFIVTIRAMKRLGLPVSNIHAITMPGFGTTDRTYDNAINLIKEYNATLKVVDIKEACLKHFEDIGHDKDVHDVTYENVQARERTQILMDYANKTGGLVIGTGDLSELALGWCTYNGDHISMYAVNTGIPKTLVRYIIQWYADNEADEAVGKILHDILDTPVSPELLPPSQTGQISQKTEDVLGPYEVHDFFLFYMQSWGAGPAKLLFLARQAFKGQYSPEQLKKWLVVFFKRFFSQQFKRSCMPDGPKVGTVSLSPRGDWKMPSDASVELWLAELES
jgi:NAD+ synthase (glutamine-hydrolysing)